MTHIYAERRLEPPYRAERSVTLRARACLNVHRVECRETLVGVDGKRMLCHFEAQDLESARIVFRQYDADFDEIWSATLVGGDASTPIPHPRFEAASNRVLEDSSFDSPVDIAKLRAEHVASVARLAEHGVHRASTIVSLDGRRVIRLYLAPDVEAVRRALSGAGLSPGAVWAYRHITGCPLIVARNLILTA